MDRSISQRLVLGTAQLGMPYGINNRTGQPDTKTAVAVVEAAYRCGIREFDTAQAYGKSEEVLGCAFSELAIGKEAAVISKIHPAADWEDTATLEASIEESIKYLRVSRLKGLMLHHEDLLGRWDAVLEEFLTSMVKKGLTERIGVSTYTPSRAIEALNKEGVHFIQVPANLVDRRFERAGVFDLAARLKKAVYIRSVFLQGLLLMDETDIPSRWAQAVDIIRRMIFFSEAAGIERLSLALGYVRWKWPQAKIVFGTELPQQVAQSVAAFQQPLDPAVCLRLEEEFSDEDERILNPSFWPQASGRR